MFWIGILFGVLGYCVYLCGRCLFRVNQGYLVVLTNFGAAVTRPDDSTGLRVFEPGLHLKWPWQHVHQVPMMEQNLELSGDEGGQIVMAADGTVLRFDSILRFAPVAAELHEYLFDLKAPREHIIGMFACLLRNEIADFRPADDGASKGTGVVDDGSYGLIRRHRKALNQRIEDFCQQLIGDRYGVRFSAVDLTDILPPDELADALNAVMQAQADADGLHSLAEADCQQRIIAAQRGVAVATQKAVAAEQEIRTLTEHLAPLHHSGVLADYVSRRRVEVLSQSRNLFLRSES